MRPVLKAFASDHPVVVFFAVVARWMVWTIVGSPIVVVALVPLVTAGAPWRVTLGSHRRRVRWP